MTQRMQMCKAKGFVAVDPDNVDAYTQVRGRHRSPRPLVLAQARGHPGMGAAQPQTWGRVSSFAQYPVQADLPANPMPALIKCTTMPASFRRVASPRPASP